MIAAKRAVAIHFSPGEYSEKSKYLRPKPARAVRGWRRGRRVSHVTTESGNPMMTTANSVIGIPMSETVRADKDVSRIVSPTV